MKSTLLASPFVALVLSAGCAASAPTELVNARSAYSEASKGPAATHDPADLQTAQQTLGVAERSFSNNGDSQETKDIAYAAQRRAQLADARGRTAADTQESQQAVTEMQAMRDAQARLSATRLVQAQQQLATQGQQLASQGQALQDAQRRADQTSSELARIASVKNDSRGMVITLSGAVLFTVGQSTILPPARAKLSEVASVLGQGERTTKIRIEGYTDSTGSAAVNEKLSQDRADAVKEFLASHGLSSDRMEARGMGPASPLADNATPEGRADNRRVEIVVLR